MTTLSNRELADSIRWRLQDNGLSVNIKSLKVVRKGSFRLVQIKMLNGAYLQTTLAPLGTHTGVLVNQAVENIRQFILTQS
jgi:hypothetical protein